MYKSRIALLAFLLAWLAILVLAAPTSSTTFYWKNATSYRTPEKQLENLVNREHERVCGIRLPSDAQLVWMARYRATDMIVNNYFAHKNPNTGEYVFAMMDAVGIQYALAGENIGWANRKDSGTAKFLFDKFMQSRTHRNLIRDCQWTKIGIGTYTNTKKSMFVILVTR